MKAQWTLLLIFILSILTQYNYSYRLRLKKKEFNKNHHIIRNLQAVQPIAAPATAPAPVPTAATTP